MELSIVVPVFKGEKSIVDLFYRIREILTGHYEFELIFVHDAGTEKSLEVLKKLESNNPEIIKSIYLKKNLGQHRAILEGIKISKGGLIITMDEDLQHDPEYIPLLITEQKKGDFDVVYARLKKLKHSIIRKLLSGLFRFLLQITIPDIYPGYSSFRLIRKNIAQNLLSFSVPYVFIDGLIGRVTNNIGYVLVEHKTGFSKQSTYSFKKLYKHAIMILFNYSQFFKRIHVQ